MNAGQLDQRITILSATTTRDSMGATNETYAPLRPTAPLVWARAMQGLGKEFVAAGNVEAQAKVAFQIRFASDIAALGAQARVAWQGRLFEVLDMTGTRRSGELWLHCQSIGKYP